MENELNLQWIPDLVFGKNICKITYKDFFFYVKIPNFRSMLMIHSNTAITNI